LRPAGVPEGEQGGQSTQLAKEACQCELLPQARPNRPGAVVAEGPPGLLEKAASAQVHYVVRHLNNPTCSPLKKQNKTSRVRHKLRCGSTRYNLGIIAHLTGFALQDNITAETRTQPSN